MIFFAEVVAFAKLFPHNLDDVVRMAVGLGENQGFGNFEFAVFIHAVREHGWKFIFVSTDNIANLAGIDHIPVELGAGIIVIFIQPLPTFSAGELFPFVNIFFGLNFGALPGDFRFNGKDIVRHVDAISNGFFIGYSLTTFSLKNPNVRLSGVAVSPMRKAS